MTSTLDVELTERVRLAEVSRTIVRAVSSELTLPRVVEVCQTAIMDGFRASGVFIQAFKGDELGPAAVRDERGRTIDLPHELKLIGRVVARTMWQHQGVTVFDGTTTPGWVLGEDDQQRVYELMAELGITRLLSVPIGAGRECLGTLVLSRRDSENGWTPGEQRAALDIGRDLGRALATARAFEKERRVMAELREVNGYKARLISTLAHELKNPLTAILGHAEMLGSHPELPPGVAHSVVVIERGGTRMQQLVEDLLVLSRSAGEHQPLDPGPVDLVAVVDEALDLLGVELLRRDVAVHRDVPDGPVVAWGERPDLELVVANLLGNAVKYTRPGGRVSVRLATPGPGSIVLEVADTGIGMSEADQEHLFEEFFRSTNPEALASPGTGLGLSIVQQAVERHGGSIEVDSALGRGTTFTVTLPGPPR